MYLKNLTTSFPVAKYRFIIQPKENIIFSKLSSKNKISYKYHKIVNRTLRSSRYLQGTYDDIRGP
jgi:hypothetical protein